ncbi:MAG: glyoxalase [Hyphomicrobiales bacterium]|nr:glyoxalase [Hyphomicrobiales bacterium]
MIPATPALVSLDHVQIAIPQGGEDRGRAFYCLILGMREIEKPAVLAARGGCWFTNGVVHVHLGVDPDFVPARKAHAAFRATGIERFATMLAAAGHQVQWDGAVSGVRRLFTADPFGNRIELISEESA